MNFLAHLYITRHQSEKVVIGNFIADAVKGRNGVKVYSEKVQLGIRVHREIDEFTDSHPIFKKGTKRLHENYGKFSPVIMDIFYDHILASKWDDYSDLPLQVFADKHYELIDRNFDLLPARTRLWFNYMRANNLLYNYSKEEDIDLVLQRMDHRTGRISGMSTAINELREFKKEYTLEFKEFFDQILDHIDSLFY